MPWMVQIISHDSGEVVKEIGPYVSERQADRADDGVNINLEHSRYFTRVSEVPASGQEQEADK